MANAAFLSRTPSDPIDTARVMFEPQPVPKSPLLAFLLSLALPGAGQTYCGKTSRGLWTLAIFLPALALTVYFTLQLEARKEKATLLGAMSESLFFFYVCLLMLSSRLARHRRTDAFIAESSRRCILNLDARLRLFLSRPACWLCCFFRPHVSSTSRRLPRRFIIELYWLP